MQAFVTDTCPIKSAKILRSYGGLRSNKMMVESCQMLACVEKKLFGNVESFLTVDNVPFKTPLSIINHRCTKWLYKSHLNVAWLIVHVDFLYWLYRQDCFANKKEIKYKNIIESLYRFNSRFITLFKDDPLEFKYKENWSSIKFENHAKSGKLNFTNIENVFVAYKKLLEAKHAQANS